MSRGLFENLESLASKPSAEFHRLPRHSKEASGRRPSGCRFLGCYNGPTGCHNGPSLRSRDHRRPVEGRTSPPTRPVLVEQAQAREGDLHILVDLLPHLRLTSDCPQPLPGHRQCSSLLPHIIHYLLDIPDRLVHLVLVLLSTGFHLHVAKGLDTVAVLGASAFRQVCCYNLAASSIAFTTTLEPPDRGRHPLPVVSDLYPGLRQIGKNLQLGLRPCGLPHGPSVHELPLLAPPAPSVAEFWRAQPLLVLLNCRLFGEEL
mmetsp:Transcript_57882/g.125139  ORF Transcript_57882/g.125139 Transcript_57882/m.125139 type:complete len:260 (-) Transcript_57882:1349-2128(-)